VEYKKDLEGSKGHSINYCETPQFRSVSKISQFTSDVSCQCLSICLSIFCDLSFYLLRDSWCGYIPVSGRSMASLAQVPACFG
jgi:hypothetical protein